MFKIKMPDGLWKQSSQINFNGRNFMAEKEIVKNNRASLEFIKEWIRPVKVHDTPIALVSAGKIDIPAMKKLLEEKPNTKVMCVKHALPILAENNIKPWACVILDTRSVNEYSSLGKSRVDLIKSAPPETIFFALARVHPSYFFVLQELNARVIGFNNHYNELAQAFNIESVDALVKNPEHKELYDEIYPSMSSLPGSCAAVCAINLAVLLGFREMHLFGYDANVKSPEDTKDKCYEVEANGKVYYVPEEFTSLGLEFETIFKVYPQQLNVQFHHYSPDSFIGGVFIAVSQPKLDTLENTLNNLAPLSEKYVKKIEDIQTDNKGYYNKRVVNKDYTIIPFRTYEEYVILQNKNSKVKSNFVYNLKNSVKQLAEYFMNFASLSVSSTSTSTSSTPIPTQLKGLCHGVGLGYEMIWFKEFLENGNTETKTDIIGTDIAKDTIRKNSKFVQSYDKVMEQDFNEACPEWYDNFDFIYSNSLQYAINPMQTIDQWMSCLKKGGLCFIDMPDIEKPYSTLFKPFSCSTTGMKTLLNKNYCVIDVVELGEIHPSDLVKKACVGKMEKHVCFIVKNL